MPDFGTLSARWRKYGQKHLRGGNVGSESFLFRDYFKCAREGCDSKKQVVFDGSNGQVRVPYCHIEPTKGFRINFP